jgi:carbon monoxide dehydrogenase subunit G
LACEAPGRGERAVVILKWNGREHVPARQDLVWEFINDPGKVARCMPDLVEADIKGPRHVAAVVHVRVGLMRTRFRYDVELVPHENRERMVVKIGGGGFGNALELTAGADLVDNGDATTTLHWEGAVTMSGPIALVGWPVVDIKAQRVIRKTFANVRNQLEAETFD